jgi:glutamate-1-semialdehyde 2,1-aminomutase
VAARAALGDHVTVTAGEARGAAIERRFIASTATSRELMARAREAMVRGITRGWGYHEPYPLVMERGEGPYLYDVDGHRYVDLANNGLSLIHGHAYPPVVRALTQAATRGSGWLVASREQIEFAHDLCARIAAFERVRFTNSGTEAGMLAVKIARAATGRPAILKAWDGFHGSYDDLEIGLYGRGELPQRVLLARFGDAASFEARLAEHGDQIAAVVMEPLLFSGLVTTAPPGFLRRVQEAAQRAGALFVLDDCLMLRLALGGSAERYGLEPDLTFLGKFIGGGLPMGVVGGRADVMDVLDPHRPDRLYHGGSFNGNLLSCVAGRVSLAELTAERIAAMEARVLVLRDALHQRAQQLGLPITLVGDGSVLGVYLTDAPGRLENSFDADRTTQLLHLAALAHGVFMGPGGEIALSTAVDDAALELVIDGLGRALEDVAQSNPQRRSQL